ncbi:MAG TPA: hypothetical protein VMH32_00335 [Burkholderiales bacterium]|nr:hypothetical protein [Burkholderiales bacterium]
MYTDFCCAQVVYKSTMPDGRVIYGNAPAPGAKTAEPMAPRTENTVPGGTPEQQEALQRHQSEREQRDTKKAKLAELEQALKEAEAARAAGREPLEGERTGTAGGGSRLNDAYWTRQHQLEDAVAEARTRLEQARAAVR